MVVAMGCDAVSVCVSGYNTADARAITPTMVGCCNRGQAQEAYDASNTCKTVANASTNSCHAPVGWCCAEQQYAVWRPLLLLMEWLVSELSEA